MRDTLVRNKLLYDVCSWQLGLQLTAHRYMHAWSANRYCKRKAHKAIVTPCMNYLIYCEPTNSSYSIGSPLSLTFGRWPVLESHIVCDLWDKKLPHPYLRNGTRYERYLSGYPHFLGSNNSTRLRGCVPDITVGWKSKMTVAKPEVLIAQLLN